MGCGEKKTQVSGWWETPQSDGGGVMGGWETLLGGGRGVMGGSIWPSLWLEMVSEAWL